MKNENFAANFRSGVRLRIAPENPHAPVAAHWFVTNLVTKFRAAFPEMRARFVTNLVTNPLGAGEAQAWRGRELF